MKHLVLRAFIGATFAILIAPAIAAETSPSVPAAAKTVSPAMSSGTIRRLDKAAGSITLTHGPIENLGMGAMTMTFTFRKGVVPASVKEGDKVRFRAEEKNGEYTVVRVEAAK